MPAKNTDPRVSLVELLSEHQYCGHPIAHAPCGDGADELGFPISCVASQKQYRLARQLGISRVTEVVGLSNPLSDFVESAMRKVSVLHFIMTGTSPVLLFKHCRPFIPHLPQFVTDFAHTSLRFSQSSSKRHEVQRHSRIERKGV